jgi:hypothetical protein
VTSRLGLRLLALLLPATLLALPAAAHAERVVTRDATGDVVSTSDDVLLDTGEELVAAPDNTSADITRTVVDHRVGRLRVTVSLRDVRRSFSDTLHMRLRTSEGNAQLLVERRGGQTYTMLLGRRGSKDCGGLLSTVDATADKVVVTVPTACIEDPRWVQVGLGMISFAVDHLPDTGDRLTVFVDVAHRTGFDTGRDGLVLGPKVRRG